MLHNKTIATLLIAIATVAANAQEGALEKIQDGLDQVRKKAVDLITPGPAEKPPAHVLTLKSEEQCPVKASATVSLANQFGEVRVLPWNEEVVQVSAVITVGADNEEVAQRIAEAVQVKITPSKDLVDIETCLPDTNKEKGFTGITVDCTLRVPASAALQVENYFGDTIVRDVRGPLTVDAQFGAVTLRNMGGEVMLSSRGIFPVEVEGLAKGGRFHLFGAPASFSKVDGKLTLYNTRGQVTIRDLAPTAELDINSEEGPVTLTLPANVEPNITATLFHGTLESNLSFERTEQGSRVVARSPVEASGPRYLLAASFATIKIDRPAGPLLADPATATARAGRPFTESIERSMPAPENTTLSVNADVGDVTLIGIDEDVLRVTAKRVVWVRRPAQAPKALEALAVHVLREGNQLIVVTSAAGDMETLGCTAYRIDLEIACPRTLPIVVAGREGKTRVEGVGEQVVIRQAQGSIEAEHIKGGVQAENKRGSTVVESCAGPVEIDSVGDITLKEIYGDITVRGEGGRTVIETPGAGVYARNKGGDIRILALKGIGGDFDVKVEEGDLSMLLPPEADASLSLLTEGGIVRPSISVEGRKWKNHEEFRTRLKEGRHRIQLETVGGDIALD